jgi:hypothetical protein
LISWNQFPTCISSDQHKQPPFLSVSHNIREGTRKNPTQSRVGSDFFIYLK